MSQTQTSEFDLCTGGLIHRLLGPLHLNQVMFIALLCWLPIPLLTLFEAGADLTIEYFALAWSTHVRFLIAVPILLFSERPIHDRTMSTIRYFLNSHVTDDEGKATVARVLEKINRVKNRYWLDLIFLVIAVSFSFSYEPATRQQEWHEAATLASSWLRHVVIPFFQMIVFRWGLRLILWSAFLWKLSRLRLMLMAHHPDGVGGLGVVRHSQKVFMLLVFALSSMLAANQYLNLNSEVSSLREIFERVWVLYAFLALLFLGPLLFFTPQLIRCKEESLPNLSRLSAQLSTVFQEKWLKKTWDELNAKPLLETENSSALHDWIEAFKHSVSIKLMLLDRDTLLAYGVATLLPFIPLEAAINGSSSLLNIILKTLT